MRTIKETVVILSASKSGCSDSVNELRKKYLRQKLDLLAYSGMIRFSPALGFYKGEAEHSFVVVVQDRHVDAVVHSLKGLACEFEQESVLVRDTEGVYLHFMHYFPQVYRAPERIGNDLCKVEFEGENRPDAFTYFNGQAWVAA